MKQFRQNFVQIAGIMTVSKAMTYRLANANHPMTSFHVLEVNDDPFQTNVVQICTENLDKFYVMAQVFL